MAKPLLEVNELHVELPLDGEMRPVLHSVTIDVREGEAVGVVGESGSGKSMTALAIARSLPSGADRSGSIVFDGTEVTDLRGAALRGYLTHGIGFVFQDPRAHINPVRTIGDVITEVMRLNMNMTKEGATQRAIELLSDVGIPDAARRLRQYPHELSGGLLQRVMIASALAPAPRLLIADEPTTALDVTTQAEVMAILDEQRRDRRMAMIFITHDLDLAGAVCDRTVVMYAGGVVEEQPSSLLRTSPLHPYTAALSRARPDSTQPSQRLEAIPGRPISGFEAPAGCSFAPRCAYSREECEREQPPLERHPTGHCACIRTAELRSELVQETLA